MMTEAPLNPKKNREKMAQIMFESIGVQKFYVGIQAVFSLYASGKTTGMVLDSGHSVTHSVPIYEGFALPHAIHKMDMGGADLTKHLWQKIREENPQVRSDVDLDWVKTYIKEKRCYVAEDFDA